MLLRSYRVLVFGLFALVFAVLSAVSAHNAQAETGVASWYGPGFAGSPTASGEVFDPYGMTAASKTLPLGTQLEVCYQSCVTVTVNDRGPYVAGRSLDLSQGAAQSIGLYGVDSVEYNVLGAGGATSSSTAETNSDYSPDVSTASEDTGQSYGQSSASTEGEGYTVQSGDTLNDLAAQLGVSADGLASANGIQNPNVLSVGQTLHY